MAITLTHAEYLATKRRINRLSQGEKKVLIAIHEIGISTNKEIARRCFRTENSISVTLSELKSMGIIEKGSNPSDKRESHWWITDIAISQVLLINDREPTLKEVNS